ncbi:MAG: squalene synthase HpnC [Maricaulaceae bacterium]
MTPPAPATTFDPETGPETPSGKGHRDENFPVGSFLLPAELRPCVAAFYAFVRAADDIADNGALDPQDKLERLEAMDQALIGAPGFDGPGYAKAHNLRAALDARGVTDRHARDLLRAFRRDARQLAYKDWDDLMSYCEQSANPVGRFLLDLHGEASSDYPASDALCSALQVLNHIQDCGEDHAELNRVYIPEDWMTRAGVTREGLAEPRLSAGMRAVLDQMLEATDRLVVQARTLPGRLTSRRLAMESAIIVELAARLSKRLRRGDPLARRVKLSPLDFVGAGVIGAAKGALRR